MEEFTALPKSYKPAAVGDYEFLRSEGLKHIEKLSSALWTDYNAHDPGITTLEALCYALTELGYRCGFDMKDLISAKDGNPASGQTLFTAKEILTTKPLTINDYRKLLVDLEGIRNAWLIPDLRTRDKTGAFHAGNEVEIFADCENDQLTFASNLQPLYLSGLYHVLLDLESDDRFGDLNNGLIIVSNPSSSSFTDGEFVFQFSLPPWKNADFSLVSDACAAEKTESLTISRKEKKYEFLLRLTDAREIRFYVSIPVKPSSKEISLADVQQMFDLSVSGKKELLSGIFGNYLAKIARSKSYVSNAMKTLHENRNLCEDFMETTTIDVEEIGFCFDVDVTPSSDIEEVQAEIFFVISSYLNPFVHFYSLNEMLEKSIPVDEIFSGPVLQHGFIDTDQLERTNLRKVVYTSDIINLLMDVKGVLSVRNFQMTKYDAEGNPFACCLSQKWCIDISPLHKPVLSTDKSKIILFKNQFPFTADYAEVSDTIQVLNAIRSRVKLTGLLRDLPVPSGRKRDTESFWPVQYDLPHTYSTGEYGLPPGATQQRTAQQRQFKAYLMFYEQLLADFFSQLSNAHRLFSIDDIKQTYFARYLKEIKDAEQIFCASGIYGNLETALSDQDSTTGLKNGWQSLFESRSVFENRRNRFLDHLLARFNESFNEYAFLMYRINYESNTEEKIAFSELSGAKRNFLAQYPALSSERAKAFNKFPQNNDFTLDKTRFWDTDNVSGLEKRISFLSGITDYSRRFLYCIRKAEMICRETIISENGEDVFKCFHSFSLTSADGFKMISPEYDTRAEAINAQMSAIGKAADVNTYQWDPGTLKLVVSGSSGERILESENPFSGKDKAMDAAKKIASEFAAGCKDPVGLHLIEHILLRPRNNSFDLLQVCLHGCECLCGIDPYSFRASVVLPCDAGHFDDMDFRKYVEERIREEAPAHIMLKICWLNNDLMRKFELAYKKWIEMLAKFSSVQSSINTDNFKKANSEMVNLLATLHSEYPQATLHDCSESSEGSNTVMLGKTVLGTYKS